MRRLSTLLAVCALSTPAAAQTKLLRFPDVHGDRVAFTYAGDIWTASTAGGNATRLTAHPGLELFAKFSPDGKWIAFTGQYDGDEQVYVIPSTGGVPRQLTFYPAKGPLAERWGYDNQVYGWTKDGKRILFRSARDSWTNGQARLYTVSVDGGSAVPLPMPLAGSGAYSPDGKLFVYSKVFRDFRPEKRYSGGQANYLAIYDFARNTVRMISKGPRAERDAMWIGDRIYFNSDRDGTFNLYAYDVASGASTQITTSRTWDVRWPSADPQTHTIVYEMNGELNLLDAATGRSTPIHITVADDGTSSRPAHVSAADQIEAFTLSPKGQRALFAARGDIFTAPIEKGYTRNLTHSSGVHDKAPAWSPDGSRIAYISDKTGEEEIYVVAEDGLTPPVQLTSGGHAMRYTPRWSATGSHIAFSDKDGRLFVLSVADKRLTEIARDVHGYLFDYTWSPKGTHLAWSMTDTDAVTSSIFAWSPGDVHPHRMTGVGFSEYAPAWDSAGNYLFFLSDREYQPQLSTFEYEFATARTTGIFALALRKTVKHPFPMESDEVSIDSLRRPAAVATAPAATRSPAEKDSVHATGDFAIDYDGIEQRVARVPLEPDNIGDLYVSGDYLVYSVSGAPYYGRDPERKPQLRLYSLKNRRDSLLVDNAPAFALSADMRKVFVRQEKSFAVFDVTSTAANTRKDVSTEGLMVDRVPREEWAEVFDEVWRRYRDFFYVKNMHGNDWEALRAQYKSLLPFVGHRSDLNYVISEMIAELNVQHTYISGGDWWHPDRPRVALAGARFVFDSSSGLYRIGKIFAGHNEEPNYRSPLTDIGVDVKTGDYVIAIDGETLKPNEDPYKLLRYKADRPVTLTVCSTPKGNTRQISYRPITSESDLVYLDMVLANKKRVDDLSGGKIGYVHLPNMGAEGLREFIKWFYPQIRKEGLIIDDRANGGGNTSQLFIDRLRRELLAVTFNRTDEYPATYPNTVFVGPMATLLDEYSSSDGDIFPAMFRQARLGPLIGKRSWGGSVGITDHGPLIDGGTVNVPQFGFASTKGEWIIEGHGVDPDIEVENDPVSVLAGKDPQLERAVLEVQRQMATKQHALPSRPQDPVKTKPSGQVSTARP